MKEVSWLVPHANLAVEGPMSQRVKVKVKAKKLVLAGMIYAENSLVPRGGLTRFAPATIVGRPDLAMRGFPPFVVTLRNAAVQADSSVVLSPSRQSLWPVIARKRVG